MHNAAPVAKPATQQAQEAVLSHIRRWLLLILVLETFGIGAELLLIGHFADPWQWLPIILMAAALPAAGWTLLARRAAPIRFFQGLMALFILTGCIGTFQHYRAKTEFQLEVNPSLQGSALFWEAMESISPPALAPGIMIQMGLLGFVCMYRHPAQRKPPED